MICHPRVDKVYHAAGRLLYAQTIASHLEFATLVVAALTEDPDILTHIRARVARKPRPLTPLNTQKETAT